MTSTKQSILMCTFYKVQHIFWYQFTTLATSLLSTSHFHMANAMYTIHHTLKIFLNKAMLLHHLKGEHLLIAILGACTFLLIYVQSSPLKKKEQHVIISTTLVSN